MVNAPTVEFASYEARSPDKLHTEESFCHAESEMLEEDDKHRNDDSMEELPKARSNLRHEHEKLKEAYAALQEKLQKSKMLETFGMEKNLVVPAKQTGEELREKDRKNVELYHQIKQLKEQN